MSLSGGVAANLTPCYLKFNPYQRQYFVHNTNFTHLAKKSITYAVYISDHHIGIVCVCVCLGGGVKVASRQR